MWLVYGGLLSNMRRHQGSPNGKRMSVNRETASQSHYAHTSDWVILILLSVVWGSSFILIKKGIAVFSPPQMASLRIAISALALLPVFFLFKKAPIPRASYKWMALVGICGSGLPAFLYAYGQMHVASSVAGILNTLTPIFTWMLGLLFFSLVFIRRQLAGILLGFIGAVIVMALEPNFTFQLNWYTALIVLATVSYGMSGNIVKTHLQNIHPIILNSIAFFFIAIPAIVYLIYTDALNHLKTTPGAWWALTAIIVLSLIGTVLANIFFFRLIQRTNTIFATSVTYLIPIMAIFWGVIDGESLAWPQFLGMAFILAGVYVLRRS